MVPNLYVVTTEYTQFSALRTGIRYGKRLDDGMSVLKYINGSQDNVDALCILHVLVTHQLHHDTLPPIPLKVFGKYPKACGMAKQCFDILRAYTTKSFDVDPTFNLDFHPNSTDIIRILTAFIVPCYVDFSIAVSYDKFSSSTPGFVANRYQYFNLFLSALGVDETNFEGLRECVSRDYPWE